MRRLPGPLMCSLILAFAINCTNAFPQSAISQVLTDLSRYFGAAANLILSTTAGVATVEAAQIPASERENAIMQLEDVAGSFGNLLASNEFLISDISAYSGSVRQNGFDAASQRTWQELLAHMQGVSTIVGRTYELVKSSQWLKVALSGSDRVALDMAFMGRITLLRRLQDQPPPKDRFELDQLNRMAAQYRQLVDSLKRLNLTIYEAVGRLRRG